MKLKGFKHARKHIGRKKQEMDEARGSSITYKDLLDASESFQEDPYAESDAWISAHRFVDWTNFHTLPTKEVKRRVIGFLNKWHCRLPASDELAENMKQTYQQSIPFLSALENESLQDFEFEKTKDVNGKQYINRDVLLKVFKNFCDIGYTRVYAQIDAGYKLRGICASKFLSLINPHLFVMWDTPICKAYGIRSPSEPYTRDEQYVPEFFPLMKEKANDVIDSYMGEKECSREEAVKAINSFRKWRPLAKLLDEYNWIMISQE